MLPHLRASGYDPYIAYEPQAPTETPELAGIAERMIQQGVEIAVFQKVHGESVRSEIDKLRLAGIRTAYAVCDRVDNNMVAATDATLVVTEYLRSLHAPHLQSRIFVVHDGIERPHVRRRPVSTGPEQVLRAVLVTSSQLEYIPAIGRLPRRFDLTVVGNYPQSGSVMAEWRRRASRALRAPTGISLTPLRGYPFQVRQWQQDQVYDDLSAADVGIIPVDMQTDRLPGLDVSYWQVKSENRLTLKMALGLPVIASPVPSYLDIIEQGVNGYIAHNRTDWLEAIDALRDPAHRERMGQAARASVLERFSMAEQVRKLIGVLDQLASC